MTKILAVDDNQKYLTSIAVLLENLIPNCVVDTAQSGADGIQKAKRKKPDTILLDLHMPELDGFEVCKRIKSDDSTKHIPVIMLTGVGTEVESRVKGLEIGADAYLKKIIDSAELAAQIKAMLRIKKAEDDLRKEKSGQEDLVKEKTRALRAGEAKYRHANAELLEKESELQSKSHRLNEVNAALDVLLKKRDEDKSDFQENVMLNMKRIVLPHLERLQKSRLSEAQMTLVGLVESNINNIVSPFVRKLSSEFLNLTPMEIRVANLIKEGKTNKEIAELLIVSIHTIITHRKNLRNKLGLRNKKTNLRSYLLSLTG
jgi:DNA-binding response OmpR family regulator